MSCYSADGRGTPVEQPPRADEASDAREARKDLRARQRDSVRRARVRARSEGRCITCRARKATEGRVTCQSCLDNLRDRKHAYDAAGLCRCGQDPIPGRTKCQICRDLGIASQRKIYAAKVARGECAWSGCHERAAEGVKRCERHRKGKP